MMSAWFKPELDYMTSAEMIFFKKMVETGELTVFRITQCKNCGADIVKEKKYCSLKCKEEKEGVK